MARKKKRRSSGFGTRTIFKWLRIISLVAPGVYEATRPGDFSQKTRNVVGRYTGVDVATGAFDGKLLLGGWIPHIVVTLLTYGVGKLAGIIRRL